jgi:hypothetical protein
MSIKAAQLYDANFFSQVGTEYICTGYMYGMSENASIDDQLANQGVIMAAQVLTDPITGEVIAPHHQVDAAKAAQAASTGGASKPGMGGYKPGSKTGGSY